jgi:hypothetical protein
MSRDSHEDSEGQCDDDRKEDRTQSAGWPMA